MATGETVAFALRVEANDYTQSRESTHTLHHVISTGESSSSRTNGGKSWR